MNLIFTSFHYNPEANKAHSIPLEIYLKNIFVSLVSAKKLNEKDDVALVVTPETFNLLPKEFKEELEQENVNIYSIEFEYFKGDNNRIWSFSFYRLSVLLTLSKENKYEKMISVDSDTISTRSYKDIWLDLDEFILLYDLNHSHEIKQAIDTKDDYYNLRGKEVYFTNYGGEFIAGNSENFKILIPKCIDILKELDDKNIQFTHGDESLLAISAYELTNENKIHIKNASPYVFRFWNRRALTLLSTCYKSNPVTLLHVPDEKSLGLLSIYKYYKKKKTFPDVDKTAKMLGIKTKGNFRFSLLIDKFKRTFRK